VNTHCYTKTLARRQLEYASSVWDNTVKRNTTTAEAVQRSAARFTCHDYRRTTSVTAMLQKLQWDSLQQRRARSRVLMLYGIHNGLVAIPASTYLHSSQLWSTPEGSKPATDRSSVTRPTSSTNLSPIDSLPASGLTPQTSRRDRFF